MTAGCVSESALGWQPGWSRHLAVGEMLVALVAAAGSSRELLLLAIHANGGGCKPKSEPRGHSTQRLAVRVENHTGRSL